MHVIYEKIAFYKIQSNDFADIAKSFIIEIRRLIMSFLFYSVAICRILCGAINSTVVSAHVTKIADNKCEYNDEKYKMDDITVGCGEYWAYGEEETFQRTILLFAITAIH